MVWSFFDQRIHEGFINNKFNHFQFDEDHILVTTDHGAWAVLSNEEYKLLRLGKANEDPNLFNTLKEKGIILTEDNITKVIQDFRERYLNTSLFFSSEILQILRIYGKNLFFNNL